MAVRITVLGASGVGKTTLASGLAEQLGVVCIDSDVYFHVPTDPPFREPRDANLRRQLLERDLARHRGWLLSGGAATWVPAPRLEYTAVVFLSLPASERLQRLRRREHARYGARITPGGDMAEDHAAFMAWTAGYDDSTSEGTNTRAAHEAFLAKIPCPVIRLESRDDVHDTLTVALAHVRALGLAD